jgi:hypothetical protein
MLAAVAVLVLAAACPDGPVLQKQEGTLESVLKTAKEQSRPVLLDLFTES